MVKKVLRVDNTNSIPDIDDLLSQETGVVIKSPVTGKDIQLKAYTFTGEDILTKTIVDERNQRLQKYLTESSLAYLIRSLKKTNQVTPALGRHNSDGTISIIYGSRRRMATYFANVPYTILAADNISDEEAAIISEHENVYEEVSLCEKGEFWRLIQEKEGLSSREISQQIEDNKISHTIIAAGITGANLPEEIKNLYPSINLIGRPTILKLSNCCKHKSSDAIVDYMKNNNAELLDRVWTNYTDGHSLSGSKAADLTNAIIAFAMPAKSTTSSTKVKCNTTWGKGISAQITNGALQHVLFEQHLNKEQTEKLKAFLSTLS
ncbi:ParB/RepB/Spo0J family partition protein [Thalassotalea sp. PLHSN55]|uniref:ParB/RepB/Spo0J family partition protein n=1 Tax=Thalassotalea sp. PLHSN55 TaxID=3435888 RepID=UPI003F8749CC